ncbi:MAG: PDZ domain-containing protein, partial [Burkholderiales bacterium]|nr:PDZ domain-containing protein [Burkholderiales bacterium]
VEGMLRVTDFAADILDSLDDAATRPTFQQTSGPPRFGRGRGLSLGVTLDMDRRSEGFVVANVQPGSSAEQGGIQAGDMIVQFGEDKIADRSSLMQAVRKYKAGDEVSVMVQRSGAEVTLKIKLQESP